MAGPSTTPAGVARVVLRPIGNPLPLGFLALGMATLGFSALQLGWVPPEQGRVVALAALLFTAPLQLLTSVLGYLARDAVAGTGMGVLAGTWALVGYTTLTSPPGATSEALGVALLASAAAMVVPAAAATSKLVACAVLTTAATRFAVTGVYELTASSTWQTAAGVVGLVLAGLAWYAALGFELEDVRRRTFLPLLRRGDAAASVRAGVEDQLAGVHHEAGVREQL